MLQRWKGVKHQNLTGLSLGQAAWVLFGAVCRKTMRKGLDHWQKHDEDFHTSFPSVQLQQLRSLFSMGGLKFLRDLDDERF